MNFDSPPNHKERRKGGWGGDIGHFTSSLLQGAHFSGKKKIKYCFSSNDTHSFDNYIVEKIKNQDLLSHTVKHQDVSVKKENNNKRLIILRISN